MSNSIPQGGAADVFNSWFLPLLLPVLSSPSMSACVCQELPCDLRFTGAAVNLRAGRPHMDLSAERQGMSHT